MFALVVKQLDEVELRGVVADGDERVGRGLRVEKEAEALKRDDVANVDLN